MKKGDKVNLIVTNTERMAGCCTKGKVYSAIVEEMRGGFGLNYFTFVCDTGDEMTVRETHMEFV